MNTNMMNTNDKQGKVFARCVFLMAQNPDTDRWEPMAYFPDMDWDLSGNKASYMSNGQHGPCCEAFALLDCIAPKRQHFAAVARLKAELFNRGYILTVLDSAEWLKSKGERAKELDRNVYEATAITDSEALMQAGERKKAYAAA